MELLKIVPDDAKVSYPRVAKSAGDAPKQYKPSTVAAASLDDEDFEDDEPHADDAAYENAHSEDETALLGSEEGEEEEAESEDELLEDTDDAEGGDFEDHSEENFDEH